jgi:hypothetical protein
MSCRPLVSASALTGSRSSAGATGFAVTPFAAFGSLPGTGIGARVLHRFAGVVSLRHLKFDS